MKKPNFPKFVFRTTLSTSLHLHVAAVVATALYWAPVVTAAEQPVVPSSISQTATSGKIDAYVARPGRTRPVVAIIGENSGTELTDFVIPYGVLMQSGVAEVIT
ncbi:MAG: hypothetical protein ABI905_16570, partial [Betaproteobacteria bacterium]